MTNASLETDSTTAAASEVEQAKGTRVWQLNDSVSIHELKDSQFAVRDLKTKTYFRVGMQEAFLLHEMRTGITYDELRARFASRFDEELEYNDFEDFLSTLADRKLLVNSGHLKNDSSRKSTASTLDDDQDDEIGSSGRGSILHYRVPFFNPNRFLDWFVQTFPFFWTKSFFASSIVMMVIAAFVLITSASDLWIGFQNALRWESVYLGMIAMVVATAIHELGHGATCKRFGGEVTETGFLVMFFMPCLYVNVSDAWIFREKWKRLAVTLAGGYCDLCIWAISVFVWRVTELDSMVNYIALVLLTTCGSRSLMNFNPMIRLDGYYMLSDILEYPNLYSQARQYWIGTLNWLLWGAKQPAKPRMPLFAFGYGMLMWSFGLGLLSWVGVKLLNVARLEYGIAGGIFVSCLIYYGVRRVFHGLIGAEFFEMLHKRTIRFVGILAMVATAVASSFWIPIDYESTGTFEVRPAGDVDVCSPLHSFIAQVCVEDGQLVERDQTIVELYAPDLVAQLASKEAELTNARAIAAKLEAGPRPEEIRVLEHRISLLKDWCSLGSTELDATKKSHQFELSSLEEKAKQIELQIELAQSILKKTEELYRKGAVAGSQIAVEKSQVEVLQSQLKEVQSKRSSVEAGGVNNAIAELAHRKRQLNDAESELLILKLGTRREEIEAAKARVKMLEEEQQFLKEQQSKLVVLSTSSGIVSAPRLREKVGQFYPKGMPICRVELPGKPNVEVMIPEAEATSLKTGQRVRLKARSLPFETIWGRVERIAPSAAKPIDVANQTQNVATRKSVTVHCTLDESEERLKSGMTGVGRVLCSQKTLGEVAIIRFYQYIRTEFWW